MVKNNYNILDVYMTLAQEFEGKAQVINVGLEPDAANPNGELVLFAEVARDGLDDQSLEKVQTRLRQLSGEQNAVAKYETLDLEL